MYCEQENDWNINIRRSSNIYLIQDYPPPLSERWGNGVYFNMKCQGLLNLAITSLLFKCRLLMNSFI